MGPLAAVLPVAEDPAEEDLAEEGPAEEVEAAGQQERAAGRRCGRACGPLRPRQDFPSI